ncbi:MAG TPA: DUF4861 family protein [Paludibacteraceae bacterium]|nr:DUF4861 family protein [Paludibacteraceae bacterium]
MLKFSRIFVSSQLLFFFVQVNSQTFTVNNCSNHEMKDIVVEIPVRNLPISIGNYAVASKDGSTVPLEIVSNLKGNQLAVFPVKCLKPRSSNVFLLLKGNTDEYPKRTYAELAHKIGGQFNGNTYEGGFSWVKPNYMKLPGTFRDHAYYIKYEGPGWESDKVGYRFYLDQRNAIDVFGKKTPGIVLPGTGIDGYDSYHNMSDWGMDNMKVGKALGIGSIAFWDGQKAVRVENRDSAVCFIPTDGKIRSQVNTTYYGWDVGGNKFNLKSLISIDAGSRASHMELQADKYVSNLTTGIIKNKDTELLKSDYNTGDWAYIATFGKQSLNNDNMGLAVFYKKKQLKMLTEDDLNHLVVLTPENGYVEYYFMATWELEWQPVNNITDFMNALDEELIRLNGLSYLKVSEKKDFKSLN